MEENKFLEAQSLKNQILKLEQWIKDTKREGAKIGVCWAAYTPEYRNVSSLSWVQNDTISYSTNELPENIKNKLIELINNEIEKLKEEFDKL